MLWVQCLRKITFEKELTVVCDAAALKKFLIIMDRYCKSDFLAQISQCKNVWKRQIDQTPEIRTYHSGIIIIMRIVYGVIFNWSSSIQQEKNEHINNNNNNNSMVKDTIMGRNTMTGQYQVVCIHKNEYGVFSLAVPPIFLIRHFVTSQKR